MGPLKAAVESLTGEFAMDRPNSTLLTPAETRAAQDFRSAKAFFIPSLKRDIVPSIACIQPPVGGVAWQSTSDGENSLSRLASPLRRGRLQRARSSRRCRASA